MNRCVMKTFGKKIGKGIGYGILYILAGFIVVAGIALIFNQIPEPYHSILNSDALPDLCCSSGMVVLVPLTVGLLLLDALKESYKECGK